MSCSNFTVSLFQSISLYRPLASFSVFQRAIFSPTIPTSTNLTFKLPLSLISKPIGLNSREETSMFPVHFLAFRCHIFAVCSSLSKSISFFGLFLPLRLVDSCWYHALKVVPNAIELSIVCMKSFADWLYEASS